MDEQHTLVKQDTTRRTPSETGSLAREMAEAYRQAVAFYRTEHRLDHAAAVLRVEEPADAGWVGGVLPRMEQLVPLRPDELLEAGQEALQSRRLAAQQHSLKDRLDHLLGVQRRGYGHAE